MQITHFYRSTRHTQSDQTGLIQPDEYQEKTYPGGKRYLQTEGNATCEPATDFKQCNQSEEKTTDEDSAKSGLPTVTQYIYHCIGNESIFTHVGRDGKRTTGIDTHGQRPKKGADDSSNQRRAKGNTRRFQNFRVYNYDIGHGHEGGQATQHFAWDSTPCFLQSEVSSQHLFSLGISI